MERGRKGQNRRDGIMRKIQLAGFENESRSQAKGCGQSLEAGKDKKTGSKK